MKARDFFGETSRRTSVTTGLIMFLLFLEGQICRVECKIRSASIFGEPSAARKFADRILFPKIFCSLNIQLKNPNRSFRISFHKYAFINL